MSAHAAVVLPGSRYEAIGPAIHVPYLALDQLGALRHVIAYPDYRPSMLEREDVLPFAEDVLSAIVRACTSDSVERVTFISKSLGTLVLGALGERLRDELSGRAVEAIWVTPLFGLDYARDGAISAGWRSLVISGGADSYFDRDGDEAVATATGGRSLVLDGADHSLQVDGDVMTTIEGWTRVAESVLDFVGGAIA